MDQTTLSTPQGQTRETLVINGIKQSAASLSGWLKFLGIVNIVIGALTALTLVGIIYAWLPIWMGVLLLQSGNSASNAQIGDNFPELVIMVQKLRTFFILTAVMVIISLAIMIISIIALSARLLPFLDQFREFQY
jgi:hypothetical protein